MSTRPRPGATDWYVPPTRAQMQRTHNALLAGDGIPQNAGAWLCTYACCPTTLLSGEQIHSWRCPWWRDHPDAVPF